MMTIIEILIPAFQILGIIGIGGALILLMVVILAS